MPKSWLPAIILLIFALAFNSDQEGRLQPLKLSQNRRYFAADNKPFFWVGDTAWLLISKMNQAEAEQYLKIRSKQGFNVIQVMMVHANNEVNAYGDSALINKKINSPKITAGSRYGQGNEYDYWDHIDWIISKAATNKIYVALVPVWGSVVKQSRITPREGAAYAEFLAKRYAHYSNIIWMNGGDVLGTDSLKTWNAIGNMLYKADGAHLITYHPRGRTRSSTWFHDQQWLSFNSIQSGHRTYAQDTSKNDLQYGEDNWKYITADYNKSPTKPTLDIEPSYEKIPYGLHDTTLPVWADKDVRRYAYWSVFAGACGYTYGNNDVMQVHKPGDKDPAYGSKSYWYKSINDAGAGQMAYLKKLMLSRPYFERVPDQKIIASEQGEKYNRLLATRGKNYAFIYTYNGRNIEVITQQLPGSKIKASWYNPRNGVTTLLGIFIKAKTLKFDPPGDEKDGNDWVLIIDAV